MDEYKSFFLALSQVNAFITFGPRFKGNDDEFQSPEIGRDPFKLPELSSFQDKAWVQQRGLTKSKKAT